MAERDTGFCLPPVLDKHDGTPRRVGFELEFSGISLAESARAIGKRLGGRIISRNAAEIVFQSESLGRFTVELDWAYLKLQASREGHQERGAAEEWTELLSQAASLFVPVEVVCPPIPVADLGVLDGLVDELRAAGAVGTDDSLLAAYGVHINVEIPRFDATTLSAYLRAFCLLQWWLVEAHDVDITRRLSPYVDLYPEAYMRRMLMRAESSMDEIFDDYLEHNPSRNRAMDMLPLLAHIDEGRVRRAVSDMKVKARPAVHYRLPNCLIDHPDWSLASTWNVWCVVERLASREEDLRMLSRAFLAAERPILGVSRGDWVEYMDRWLRDRALA
jgi:hypothetical protein